MTVPSSTARDQQAGNSITTAFTVPFRILDQTHIRVLFTAAGVTTEKVLTTDYTVANVGAANTTINFVAAPPSGTVITFLRNVPLTQETDYVPNDPFPAESHERELDKGRMIDQQLQEQIDRSLVLPENVSGVSVELPDPAATELLGWNAAGNALRNYSLGELATSIVYGDMRYDVFTAVAAQTDFTLSADPGALGNLDVAIDGVVQVPGTDYTFSGTTLTFTAPMAGGEKVLARYGEALPAGVTNATAVTYNQGGTGAVDQSVAAKLRQFLCVDDFANPSDPDDTLAFQRAAAVAEAGEVKRILILSRQYDLSATVEWEGAIEWHSAGFEDMTISTTGGGHTTSRPSIRWTGAADGIMFRQKPDAVGSIVNGGGFMGVHLDGNTLAGIGYWADNCRYTEIGLHGRGFRECLLKVSSTSATAGDNSQKVIIRYLRFVFGLSSQPDVLNACGVIIEGDGTTITQVFGYLIDGSVYDGSLLRITQHDNGQFYYVRGNVNPGGSGYAVEVLSNGGVPSAQDGSQNVFFYVAGNVYFDANTINNRLLHWNSEAGTITGAGQYHADVLDVISAERFQSHAYKMRDARIIPTSEFIAVSGGATRVLSNGVSPAWSFPLGVDARIAAILPAPYDWGKGKLTGIRVYITPSGAEAGANVVIGVRLSDPRDGTSIIAVPARVDFTVGINNTAGTVEVHDLILGTAEDYVKYSMVAVSVTMVGTSGAHTVANPPHLLGVAALFESVGSNRPVTPAFTAPQPNETGY